MGGVMCGVNFAERCAEDTHDWKTGSIRSEAQRWPNDLQLRILGDSLFLGDPKPQKLADGP